jgi:hypothetical protein
MLRLRTTGHDALLTAVIWLGTCHNPDSAGLGWPPNAWTLRAGLPRQFFAGCAGAPVDARSFYYFSHDRAVFASAMADDDQDEYCVPLPTIAYRMVALRG